MQALDPSRFQGEIDGATVGLYTLRNSQCMVACISNYGAKIEQLIVPDRHGLLGDVVLGYDSLEAAVDGSPSMGAFIGRYAGRIGGAAFALDGTRYNLSANNGPHCLHGGVRGSRFRVFDAVQNNASSVEMRCLFADGEEGFPGTLALRLMYSLTEHNELVLDYEATALDKPTVASFTTHAFFNLNGEFANEHARSVLGHEVMICADSYFPMTDDLVAIGDIESVENTALDFRQPTVLGTRVGKVVDGYDGCYLVNRAPGHGLVLAARVTAPAHGRAADNEIRRVMEVWSTEPALQFYTGLQAGEPLAGGLGKGGVRYLQQQSFCLEPQGYPNAPNCPAFESSIYQPGQSRAGKTVYRFSHPV
jgi:aldose 1-epimerase